MFTSFNSGESVNGYRMERLNGLSQFAAENNAVRIWFETDAGTGRNYSKILGYWDKKTNRSYRAMRHLYKYVSTVQGFSNALYARYRHENGCQNIEYPQCRELCENCSYKKGR